MGQPELVEHNVNLVRRQSFGFFGFDMSLCLKNFTSGFC